MQTESSGVECFRELVDELYRLSKYTAGTLTVGELRDVRDNFRDLLRVESSQFDERDYKDIKLTIFWIDAGIDYHAITEVGNVSESIAISRIVQSLGNAGRSLSTLNQLDRIDAEEGDSTTDLSQKLTVANKIRSLMDDHTQFVTEVSAKGDLIDQIHILYVNDMYYRERGDDGEISFDSQLTQSIHTEGPLSSDEILNDVYNYGFTRLLATLNPLDTKRIQLKKIRLAAVDTVDQYLTKRGILFVYNSNVVIEFHRRIWGLVKFCFRNNVDYDVLTDSIDSFSELNPVFPIMRLFLKQALEEQSLDNDGDNSPEFSAEFTDESDEKSLFVKEDRIPPPQELISILRSVVEPQANTLPQLLVFVKALEIYSEFLDTDGIQYYSDYYYCAVSRSTSAWINKDTSLLEFYAELQELATVSTSKKHSADGHVMANDQLIEAALTARYILKVERDFMGVLKDTFVEETLYDSKLMTIRRLLRAPYFTVWKIRYSQNKNIEQQAYRSCNKYVVHRYMKLWRHEYDKYVKSIQEADKYLEKRMFYRWKGRKQCTERVMVKKLREFELNHTIRRYFKYMLMGVRAKNSKAVKMVDSIILTVYLNRWLCGLRTIRELEKKSANFYVDTLYRSTLFLWKMACGCPFQRLKILNEAQTKFTLQRYLHMWLDQLMYANFEGQVIQSSIKLRKRYFFNYWKTIYDISLIGHKADKKLDVSVARRLIKEWKEVARMKMKADNVLRKHVMSSSLNQWRLKLRFIDGCTKRNSILARKEIRLWRLETKLREYQNQFDSEMVTETFKLWKKKVQRCTSDMKESEEVNRYLTLQTYMKFWGTHFKTRVELNDRANRLKEFVSQRERIRLIQFALDRWKLGYYELKEKEDRIENIYRGHLLRTSVTQCFDIWKKKFTRIKEALMVADNVRDSSLMLNVMLKWLNQYDRLIRLDEMYQNHVSMQDVELLRSMMSRMSLRLIKYQTDYRNADMFKLRWQKHALRAFFDIWNIKLENKKQSKDEMATVIGNPYIELERNGSRLSSIQSESSSDLTLISSSTPSTLASLVSSPGGMSPPRLFRTPIRHNKTSLSSSAKRARRLNLEQRVNHYKQAKQRSPEKMSDSDSVTTPTRARGSGTGTETVDSPLMRLRSKRKYK
ncbi:hypothetical protein FOA43_000824 [Brettanomyces nanus]|uniref:Sfi1 spindle body domain-containing protein n=1 Tax=Eeniella nana TaxID=13502 RepID=A0A875RY52_EENNA|nr:uncharacterized protein FOA43_000824 [Brettanomyces nanus]QPG73513.1 hypothetical protein FOA43_000824 [Brettanomyces nanus]